MNEITIPMALLDFLPVILCGFAVSIQIKDFCGRMLRDDFALFSAGAVMLVLGGFFKALWKLLFAFGICDYPALSEQFFPNQASAFVLLGYSSIHFLLNEKKSRRNAAYAGAVPVLTTKIPFIVLMFWGMCCWYISLVIFAFRKHCKKAGIFIIAAWILMTSKSALGTRFDNTKGFMHWLAESANSIGQLFLLMGTISLHHSLAAESQTEKSEQTAVC